MVSTGEDSLPVGLTVGRRSVSLRRHRWLRRCPAGRNLGRAPAGSRPNACKAVGLWRRFSVHATARDRPPGERNERGIRGTSCRLPSAVRLRLLTYRFSSIPEREPEKRECLVGFCSLAAVALTSTQGYHIQGRQQARKLPNPDAGR